MQGKIQINNNTDQETIQLQGLLPNKEYYIKVSVVPTLAEPNKSYVTNVTTYYFANITKRLTFKAYQVENKIGLIKSNLPYPKHNRTCQIKMGNKKANSSCDDSNDWLQVPGEWPGSSHCQEVSLRVKTESGRTSPWIHETVISKPPASVNVASNHGFRLKMEQIR